MATNQQTISENIEQEQLRDIFLVNTRQRFKAQVNYMTSGAMLEQLTDQQDAAQLSFIMSYLHVWHWLRHNIPADRIDDVLATFVKTKQGPLIKLLRDSTSAENFLQGYISHWQQFPANGPIQQQDCLALLEKVENKETLLLERLLRIWAQINPFIQSQKIAYRDLAREERERYDGMLGAEDKERLALIDNLPDDNLVIPSHFPKLGLIPAMGCPQTCRHCMFIFRPLMKNAEDPTILLNQVNALTNSVLFTGGDLTKQLDYFYQAISTMSKVSTFAILLNGDFANDRKVTRSILEKMARSIRQRPPHWPKAKVMLQISFDEFHQEIIVDKHGDFRERIPVKKIANIVEQAPRFPDEIQLCLLHKQHALNFSMEVFQKGVFARLANELAQRGFKIEIQSATPSARLKRNPLTPKADAAPVVKDASFTLDRFPKTPIMFTSSTIDAYGRAKTIDMTDAVRERDLLDQLLAGKGTGGETFDKDIMFWYNGWTTLFSAVHMSLGNVFEDGMETILKRLVKDPLTNALHRFDLRLLDIYREREDDLDEIIKESTSPHHLFHTITETAEMRLFMTQRLLEI